MGDAVGRLVLGLYGNVVPETVRLLFGGPLKGLVEVLVGGGGATEQQCNALLREEVWVLNVVRAASIAWCPTDCSGGAMCIIRRLTATPDFNLHCQVNNEHDSVTGSHTHSRQLSTA